MDSRHTKKARQNRVRACFISRAGGTPARASSGEVPLKAEGTSRQQPESSGSWRPPNSHLLGSLFLSAFMFVGCQREATTPPSAAAAPDIEAITASAEGGDAAAQWQLATLYAQGREVEQDYGVAADWYGKAAAQGHAAAQAALGELYEAGQGVEQDDARAAMWYRKAAEQGNVKGQYNLAVLYTMGQGVEPDPAEAIKWYRLAAEQGDVYAQYNLGMRYFLGNGVPPDVVQAYKWLTLAANQKLTDAAMARDKVERSMTREQLAEGRSRVAKFTPRTNAPSADPSASRH